MPKKLVNLYVPGLAQNYDVLVPVEVPVRKLIPVLIEGINNLNSNAYTASGKEMLLVEKMNAVLNPERPLRSYDVSDGDRIILI